MCRGRVVFGLSRTLLPISIMARGIAPCSCCKSCRRHRQEPGTYAFIPRDTYPQIFLGLCVEAISRGCADRGLLIRLPFRESLARSIRTGGETQPNPRYVVYPDDQQQRTSFSGQNSICWRRSGS